MKDGFILRRTGETTATAFETIARAIRNPGKTIRVVDHFQETESGDRNLYNTILRILVHMDLKFEVKRSRGRYTIKSLWYGIAINPATASWKILTEKDRAKLNEIDV